MNEIYRKLRPRDFDQVVGQDRAVKVLEGFLKKGEVPHAILFTGPSGCGKTTLARILGMKLGCCDKDTLLGLSNRICNFEEINAAESRGIDTVRDIKQRMGLSAFGGGKRAWVLDEVHKLTGDAQTALLKILEDPPDHVWFFLCTTDPAKLLKTIHTRCTEIRLGALPQDKIVKLLIDSIGRVKPEFESTGNVIEKIAESADGSARKALVLLQQVMGLEGEEAQLDAVEKADSRKQAIDLCRLMMKSGAKWDEIRWVIEKIDEEPETVRRIILGYASSVLLHGGKMSSKAAAILGTFRDHWYDCGRAGLVMSCWEVFGQKE